MRKSDKPVSWKGTAAERWTHAAIGLLLLLFAWWYMGWLDDADTFEWSYRVHFVALLPWIFSFAMGSGLIAAGIFGIGKSVPPQKCIYTNSCPDNLDESPRH